MDTILMKGNEVVGEAAARAGCNMFCGYPITPSSETLEYVSARFPELGRQFVQAESELAAINMVFGAAAAGFRVMTASSGPGFDLKQEGISYIASCDLPCVIVDVCRYGSGLGAISPGQNDYLQATKGGGHGDYKVLVYAPNSVQEIADLMVLANDKADEYRMPVLILSDGALGQMMEPVTLPEFGPDDQVKNKPWALRGRGPDGERNQITTALYVDPDFANKLRKKYAEIEAKETRAESYLTDDAEVVLVSYGISSRIAKEAVNRAREKGIKLGLFRPISLWPFPKKELGEATANAKAVLSVEMSSLGQMVEDVALHLKGRLPIYLELSDMNVPQVANILKKVDGILNGSEQEVY
ncbi:MAG: 3-methyl-2-oxobutanoate dehydrogenase subunit VorB [Clostridiales Family XIII bacterium]|nr:3-methyl-2-oxobutanoate dehydrogenase subunit VorB [Clostridiales Family XIII bacterium]